MVGTVYLWLSAIASRILALSCTIFLYLKILYAVYLSHWDRGRMEEMEEKLYKKKKKKRTCNADKSLEIEDNDI